MKKYFWQYRGRQLILLLLYLGLASSQVLSSMALTPIIDAIVKQSPQQLIHWGIISLSLWLWTIINDYLVSVYQAQTIRLMSNQLRVDFAKTISSYSVPQFKQQDQNQYVSWLSNDIKAIQDNGFKTFYQLLSCVITAIFTICALAYYHYSLAIIAFIFSIILMYVPKLFSHVMDRASTQLKAANGNFMAKVSDIIGGFTIFKNHQLTKTFQQRIHQSSDQFGQVMVDYTQKTEAVNAGVSVLNIISQMATLGWTAFLVLRHLISIGVISTSGNLSGMLFSNLSTISTNLFTIQSVRAILAIDLKQSPQNSVTMNYSFNQQFEVKDLSFSYDNQPILNHLNYTFIKGGKYALAGKSGVGKSTLFNLLAGQLTGYQGELLLDGQQVTNGSSEIEYVEQKPYLLNTTLRDNLTLGQEFSEQRLQHIISELAIDQFMTLDTPIVGHGQNLSGGQRQRIALARALVHRKPIIFLDEVTAGLDEQSAQQIETKLLQDPNLTLIMITHHLTEQTRQQLTGILDLSVA